MRDSKKKNRILTGERVRLVLFLLVLLGVLEGLSCLLDPVENKVAREVSERDQNMYTAMTEEKDTIDAVVMGDSESVVLLSPKDIFKDTGVACYIVGGPGRSITEEYYSLRSIMKTQKPKLVILESNCLTLKTNYNSLRNMAEYYTSVRTSVEYYVPIFRNHNSWMALLGHEPEWAKLDMQKGWISRKVSQPYTGGDHMAAENATGDFHIPWIRKHYLKEIKALCDENGAKLLVLTMPSPLNVNPSTVKALEEETGADGIDYLDLNTKCQEIGIDWTTDTIDGGDHVNDKGTAKIKPYLEKYIGEHYDLPDHRGDTKYNSWK